MKVLPNSFEKLESVIISIMLTLLSTLHVYKTSLQYGLSSGLTPSGFFKQNVVCMSHFSNPCHMLNPQSTIHVITTNNSYRRIQILNFIT
jgi:hypothetical protein